MAALGTVKIFGIPELKRALKLKSAQIERHVYAGLYAAGLKVQAESQRRVPVETGNLRASAYVQRAPDRALDVEVGYAAEYALFVHENMEQKLKGEPRPSGLGVYWGPTGQPKFLESALLDMESEIIRTVLSHARLAVHA